MKITTEQLRAAFNNLPHPARAFLTSEAFGNLMQAFGQKYGLHVDVVGQLSEAVSYMLLGFINPAQFQDELKAMEIPDATTSSIIQDLNEKMFKPLQEKIRNAPPEELVREEEEEEPALPAPSSVPPAPIPPQPRPQPLQPPAPTVPIMPPINVTTRQIPSTPAVPPPTPVTEQVTELIQEQRPPENPPLHVSSAPQVPPPQQPVQTPTPAPRSTSPQSQQNRDALRQVLEGYKGVDPYRETPE